MSATRFPVSVTENHMDVGAVVLVGDHNWRKGPRLKAALAFVFGHRQRFEHLDKHCTVAWFCGTPYLIHMRGDS